MIPELFSRPCSHCGHDRSFHCQHSRNKCNWWRCESCGSFGDTRAYVDPHSETISEGI